jgi:hypothetical protein
MLASSRLTLLLLLLIIATGFGFRSIKANQFERLEHDDQLSFLAAAGKLDRFVDFKQENANRAVIMPAAQWQDYFTMQPALTLPEQLTRITEALQREDIHPPLYFYWLHAVTSLMDPINTTTGWLANALIYVANALLLFLLSRRLLGHDTKALIAVMIWSWSVAAIETAIVARHYEALTLTVLISTIYLLWMLDQKKFQLQFLLLYGVTLAFGFLTNYQFLYHIAALSLLIAIECRHTPSRIAAFAAVTLAALAAALAFYPALLEQSAEVRSWTDTRNLQVWLFRLNNVVEELLKYCIPGVLAWIILSVKRIRWLRDIDLRIGVLLAVNLVCVVGLYLSFISPKHAMGERYLASVWPFLSMLFALILHAFWQRRANQVAIILLVLLPALLFLKKPVRHPAPPSEALASAPVVIADFNAAGEWPAVFMLLKPEQTTIVASQQVLLNDFHWQETVRQAGEAIYCSDASAGNNSKALQHALLDHLGENFLVTSIASRAKGLRVYRVQALPAEQHSRVDPT